MDPVLDKEKIKLKFEGQSHHINADTLAGSLTMLLKIFKEINVELRTNKDIEVKVEALAPGSFDVQVIISVINNSSLLGAMSTVGGAVSVIVYTYTGLVKLSSFLRNKNNKKIENIKQDKNKTIIKTNNGNIYSCNNVVYNIYNNSQVINDSISSQFKILEDDLAIEGLTLSAEKELFSIPRDEFSLLAQKVEVMDENRKKEVKKLQTVYVVKSVFEKSQTRRWEFIWNGSRISANIADISFLERVEKGEHRFGTGDSMVVDLQINQSLSSVYNTWLNESYQIILVHKHTPHIELIKKISLFD